MNNQINIDDVLCAIDCAQRSSAQTAEDYRDKAKKGAATSNDLITSQDVQRVCIHTAEMFEQQAARIGKLLDQLEVIHEAGYDYVGGVGERDEQRGLVRP
jgi:hypothetical protein